MSKTGLRHNFWNQLMMMGGYDCVYVCIYIYRYRYIYILQKMSDDARSKSVSSTDTAEDDLGDQEYETQFLGFAPRSFCDGCTFHFLTKHIT